MAEVTAMRNNALPYPIYAQTWTVVFPLLDADGDLVTGATTPDSERSLNGDTFADCTNEMVEIATGSGVYYLILTAAEMTADIVSVIAKSATAGMKTTVATLYPRKLATVRSGTAAGGAAGSITLDSGASAIDDFYNGCVVIGTLDATVEIRTITDYVGSTKVASVTPNWVTTPDTDDTFVIVIPDGMQVDHALQSKIYSDTTHIHSDTTTIQSDTTTLASDLAEGDFSDILSRLTVTNSNILIVKSDTSDIRSHLVVIHSETTAIQSDTTTLASDLAEGDFSDILSRLTVMQAVISDIQSDTNVMVPIISDIQSDTSDIQSKLVALAAVASDIQSDTNVMVPIVSDIQSDTNAIFTLTTKIDSDQTSQFAIVEPFVSDIYSDTTAIHSDTTRIELHLQGVVLEQGTIGATGNDSTHVHLDGFTYGDDEINNYLLVIHDVSADEYHSRYITDYVGATDLATVSTLPFTPEDSVDRFWLLSPQQSSGALSAGQDSKLTEINSQVVRIHSDTITLASDLAEADFSDIHSLATKIYSDTTFLEASGGSLTAAQDSKLTEINSQVVRIHSDTITLASDLAEGDFSDILSRLTVTNSQLLIVKSDTSDIRSHLVLIHSETTAIQGIVSDIQSDTNVMVPIISDIQSDTSDIQSKLVALAAVASDIQSDTNVMVPIISDIQSDTSDIQSKLVALAAVASDIQSDTNKLVSDATEVDTSDIQSLLTKVYSDTTAIEAGGSLTVAQASQLAEVNSQVVRIHSDTVTLASDLAEGDFSDILSRLTVTNSNLLIVKSDTSDINSLLVKVYSDTTIATTAAGEPGQGAPPVSATPQDKTAYLYKAFRNKIEQTSTTFSLYDDAGTTVDQKATVADDAVTFTREEIVTGP